jgi:putative DNA primase/helicase
MSELELSDSIAPSLVGAGEDKFAVGDRVTHNEFGEGTVVASNGVKLAIEFDEVGVKFMLNTFVEHVRPPNFSDEAIALEFAERHSGDLRFVAAWGKWLHWDGTCWRFDDTLLAFDLARKICRDAATRTNKPKIAAAVASAKTVAAVERLARADRRLASSGEQWDADIWLLNTPGSIVDLRTGDIKPNDPTCYMTKQTGAAPNRSCPIPLWLKFLDDVCLRDQDMIAFLQRMSGYALTGVTADDAIFFLYGVGHNGKTTLVETLAGCLGGYSREAPIETFLASNSDKHPTELAALRGARLVTADEIPEGRRWNEARLKLLSGGGKVSARFMRQDFFDFVPQCKLLFSGNHKPTLRSVNKAIRRRFNLVQFTVDIADEAQDKQLPDRLKAEWPGILAWMIEGALEWQRIGLAPPSAVRTATEAYLKEQDTVLGWIDERCTLAPSAWASVSQLFASWRDWCEKNGEYPGTKKAFSQKLADHKFEPRRGGSDGGAGFLGLRLKLPSEEHGGTAPCSDEVSF